MSNCCAYVILQVECYCCLPLRITSRVWGGFANLQLPVSLRTTIYSFYAKIFKANLDEIDAALTEFPSLSDFFVRALKPDARIISQDTNMVKTIFVILFYHLLLNNNEK